MSAFLKLLTFGIVASLVTASMASAAPAEMPVHVIVHIDIMPDHRAAGASLLENYAQQARAARGVQALALIRNGGPDANHFILDETFADDAAYRQFVQADFVRHFRASLYPHLGSPWDERVGTEVR